MKDQKISSHASHTSAISLSVLLGAPPAESLVFVHACGIVFEQETNQFQQILSVFRLSSGFCVCINRCNIDTHCKGGSECLPISVNKALHPLFKRHHKKFSPSSNHTFHAVSSFILHPHHWACFPPLTNSTNHDEGQLTPTGHPNVEYVHPCRHSGPTSRSVKNRHWRDDICQRSTSLHEKGKQKQTSFFKVHHTVQKIHWRQMNFSDPEQKNK